MFHKMKGKGIAPARPDTFQILTGLIGGIAGIGVTSLLAQLAGVPLLMAPFGATCVLLFAASQAPLAQPRNVIGGHVVATAVGLAMMATFGNGMWQMAVGVGAAIALMQTLRVVHPPAGANPLVVLMAGVHNWEFLITPVLAGSVVLVVIALFINNVGRAKEWPHYWV
ncbi:HPP family protein [Chromohalobacter canadensis]|uniref:HPP family protein n=1 Tax=Chromohalobacter canadensis TaxID=141389 RepID=A0ABZ0YBW1_9GAMM|nr:HPP family protein [Chromohalobacter canadensis]MCK0769966.1 HPP family protein [Chromohalobacter canadensis]WQH09553.1 HPP family protein [Chromohalobacter canadensis]